MTENQFIVRRLETGAPKAHPAKAHPAKTLRLHETASFWPPCSINGTLPKCGGIRTSLLDPSVTTKGEYKKGSVIEGGYKWGGYVPNHTIFTTSAGQNRATRPNRWCHIKAVQSLNIWIDSGKDQPLRTRPHTRRYVPSTAQVCSGSSIHPRPSCLATADLYRSRSKSLAACGHELWRWTKKEQIEDSRRRPGPVPPSLCHGPL